MASILKKFTGHCRQTVTTEIFSIFEGRACQRKYGSRPKSHMKTVGLLSYYQIQQGNRVDCSWIVCPEPPGSREMGFADQSQRAGRSNAPVSVSCIHSAAIPSSQFASTAPENIASGSASHSHIRRTNKFNLKIRVAKMCGSHAAANPVHSFLAPTGFREQSITSYAEIPSCATNDHVSWFGFLNSRQQILKNRNGKIKLGAIHIRHFAARARSHRPVQRQKNYYEVLGITPNATQAQVKTAYFNLSKIYHPDKNADRKDAHGRFAAINEAYSVLGNLTLRKRYDRGTLNQKDIHGEVSREEKAQEHHHKYNGDPVYTGSGVPFTEEAQRQAKNMDDFFSKHYKEALDKERRERAERKQRMDEYLEMQQKAKLSPAILAVFMLMAVTFAVKSVSSSSAVDKKLRGGTKEKL